LHPATRMDPWAAVIAVANEQGRDLGHLRPPIGGAHGA
jgi:hypothetical protein